MVTTSFGPLTHLNHFCVCITAETSKGSRISTVVAWYLNPLFLELHCYSMGIQHVILTYPLFSLSAFSPAGQTAEAGRVAVHEAGRRGGAARWRSGVEVAGV